MGGFGWERRKRREGFFAARLMIGRLRSVSDAYSTTSANPLPPVCVENEKFFTDFSGIGKRY